MHCSFFENSVKLFYLLLTLSYTIFLCITFHVVWLRYNLLFSQTRTAKTHLQRNVNQRVNIVCRAQQNTSCRCIAARPCVSLKNAAIGTPNDLSAWSIVRRISEFRSFEDTDHRKKTFATAFECAINQMYRLLEPSNIPVCSVLCIGPFMCGSGVGTFPPFYSANSHIQHCHVKAWLLIHAQVPVIQYLTDSKGPLEMFHCENFQRVVTDHEKHLQQHPNAQYRNV